MLVDPGALRPAGVSDAEAGAQLGLHDPAGDGRRARLGEQTTRLSGERRFDPDLGQPGGPRVDGRAWRAPARADGRETPPRCGRDRGAGRRARMRFPRAAASSAALEARARARCGAKCRISTTTDISIPTSPPPTALVASGALIAAAGDVALPRCSERHMTPPGSPSTRRDAPLIVSIPHAGTDLADSSRGSSALAGAQATPTGISSGSTISPADSARPIVRTSISRTVIDVNRDPSGVSLYPGQATTELCPTTTFDGEPLYRDGRGARRGGDRERARALYFAPYHAALRAEIARLQRSPQRVAIYDCHSIRSRSRGCSRANCRCSISAPTAARALRRLCANGSTASAPRAGQPRRRRPLQGRLDHPRTSAARRRASRRVQMELACRAYMAIRRADPGNGRLRSTKRAPRRRARRSATARRALDGRERMRARRSAPARPLAARGRAVTTPSPAGRRCRGGAG